jgi:hypothetical protein
MPNFHRHSLDAERRLEAEWTAAVKRDRGHPSIVTWVPVNESFGLDEVGKDVAARFLDRLYRLTHELDGTRPVVSNDGWEHATTDLCTLHDYNPAHVLKRRYGAVETALDSDAHLRPPYLPGYEFRGEPLVLSEFGGVTLAGSAGLGWSDATNAEDLLNRYREMVEALMQHGPVRGFCYTQLTDIEHEKNGLATVDRRPKVDPGRLREATQTPKRL